MYIFRINYKIKNKTGKERLITHNKEYFRIKKKS